MSWEKILKSAKKPQNIKLAQYKAALRMNVGKYGKNSEEVQDLGRNFMKTNPTEKELDDIMEYFGNLKDKAEIKQQTSMDELRAKQKESQRKLDSKRGN